MLYWEKSPPKAIDVLAFSQAPAEGHTLASFFTLLGAEALPGKVTNIESPSWYSFSAETSTNHSTPLLFQHEISQISVNFHSCPFALQQRNAPSVGHWSQWGNSSLLFSLNAKVHLIYLERCGVLQHHSHCRQPEMWAAIERYSSTHSFVMEALFSLLCAEWG